MALIIGTVLALFFLDGWLRIAVIGGAVLIEVFEIFIWLRWRGVRSTTGAESLVGMSAEVVSECKPRGQVQVKGQIWTAECAAGAAVGDRVTVEAVNGLTLSVTPG
ncbi:MAG TPA: NfeD family protein [Actinomycetota bacterium]|nr:NfeD family protein [Actinomycetota bacterium]